MSPGRRIKGTCWLLAGLVAWFAPPSVAGTPAKMLYQAYCASCHGPGRLGGLGPPLLPHDLRQLSRTDVAEAIADGLPDTHMPAFSNQLSPAQIRALVSFIYGKPTGNRKG